MLLFVCAGATGVDQRIFQTLVEGQRRANQTVYCNIPAQLHLVMHEYGENESIDQVFLSLSCHTLVDFSLI
jgi:hypothetical protein